MTVWERVKFLWAKVEKPLGPFDKFCRESSLLSILYYLERLGVILVVVSYCLSCPARTREKHYQAWTLINSAARQPGNGGRSEALTALNRDHQSLAHVPLAGAELDSIDLPGADLRSATLDSAHLSSANLRGARLSQARAARAVLNQANLHESLLDGAVFPDAKLIGADLGAANATRINLRGAVLRNANARHSVFLDACFKGTQLDEADLRDTDLRGADLDHASLKNADLRRANLQGVVNWTAASLSGARMSGAQNLPPGLLDYAIRSGAVVPSGPRSARPAPLRFVIPEVTKNKQTCD